MFKTTKQMNWLDLNAFFGRILDKRKAPFFGQILEVKNMPQDFHFPTSSTLEIEFEPNTDRSWRTASGLWTFKVDGKIFCQYQNKWNRTASHQQSRHKGGSHYWVEKISGPAQLRDRIETPFFIHLMRDFIPGLADGLLDQIRSKVKTPRLGAMLDTKREHKDYYTASVEHRPFRIL